jgi:hypothetical protein
MIELLSSSLKLVDLVRIKYDNECITLLKNYIVIHRSDDLLYNNFIVMIHVKYFLSEWKDSINC